MRFTQGKISIGADHAAAIGGLGHIYVWGMNDLGQLGLADREKDISQPLYYKLNHPLYELDANYVACEKEFTIIIASSRRKKEVEEIETLNTSRSYSENEADLLAQQIKERIVSYLKREGIKFYQRFPNRRMREETLISFLRHDLQLNISISELRQFAMSQEFLLPGNKIDIAKLYEYIKGYQAGKGILAIFGKTAIPMKTAVRQKGIHVKNENFDYQLVSLPFKQTAKKVSCGNGFVLVLSEEGRMFTWGTYQSAVHGPGRKRTYTRIGEISYKSTIQDIGCGNEHCIAVTVSGVVIAWGQNKYGCLGIGNSFTFSETPITVSLYDETAKRVYVRKNVSICLTDKGHAYAWGNVDQYASLLELDYENKPSKLELDNFITHLAMGKNSIVFLNHNGQLMTKRFFNSHIVETNLSLEIEHLSSKTFIDIVAKGETFMAITNDGTLYTWGQRDDLLLRSASEIFSIKVPYPISSFSQQFFHMANKEEKSKQTRSNKVVAISCGDSHTLLLTQSGDILATGSNEYGQVGIIQSSQDEDEEEFYNTAAITNFQFIHRSCFGNSSIEFICCGWYHNIAVSSLGQAYGWGRNEHGELGLGTLIGVVNSPQILDFFSNTRIIKASCGDTHTLFLTSNGDVYSCGSSENGKLGVGPVQGKLYCHTPIKIKQLKDVTDIASSEGHNLALSGGIVYVWGEGWHGQLGIGSKENMYEPITITGLTDIKKVACGSMHSVCLDSNGIAYAWGEGASLGLENDVWIAKPMLGLENINFIHIAAGDRYTLATTITGKVFGWGKARKGRLSVQESEGADLIAPNIITTTQDYIIQSASCGRIHAGCVSTTGEVLVWGFSVKGRLGDDSLPLDKGICIYPTAAKLPSIEPEETTTHATVAIEDDTRHFFQIKLLNESEEKQEESLKDTDFNIMNQYTQIIEKFQSLDLDENEEKEFFARCKLKTLQRLQERPFNIKLEDPDVVINEIYTKQYFYEALISTLQLHPCYMVKIMIHVKQYDIQKKFLGLIYSNIECDQRLIDSATIFTKLYITHQMQNYEGSFPPPFISEKKILHSFMLRKIILSNQNNLDFIRNFIENAISNMINIAGDDRYGVDPDPFRGLKDMNIQNQLSAFSLNKNNVMKRLYKLTMLMERISDDLFNKKPKDAKVYSFSGDSCAIIQHIYESICDKFGKKVGEKIIQNSGMKQITNICMGLMFEVFSRALNKPLKYFINIDTENKKRFKTCLVSMSKELRAFFNGEKLGEYQWYKNINSLNTDMKHAQKFEYFIKLLNKEVGVELETLKNMFEHSLKSAPVITVNIRTLLQLHKVLDENIETFRINIRQFDPLVILMDHLSPIPNFKLFPPEYSMNLSLMTRCLIRDQSLVRCPDCRVPIPREMAPQNYKPIMEMFIPMGPSSIEFTYTYILKYGPRKSVDQPIRKYLSGILKQDGRLSSDIKLLQEYVRHLLEFLNTDLENMIEKNLEYTNIKIEKDKILRSYEDRCIVIYKSRKRHFRYQKIVCNVLNEIADIISMYSTKNLSAGIRNQIEFNLEYGCSNRELEAYSDNIMYKIYMNVIRDYTVNKTLSVDLFENLKKDSLMSLKPYKTVSLNRLLKKGIAKEYNIPVTESKIKLQFEGNQKGIQMTATCSERSTFCFGQQNAKSSVVLFNYQFSVHDMIEIRELSRNRDRSLYTIHPTNSISISFQPLNFLKFLNSVQNTAKAYIQNVHINSDHQGRELYDLEESKLPEETSIYRDITSRTIDTTYNYTIEKNKL